MSFKQVQKDAHDWTKQFSPQYWPPYEIFARLAEETGEVGRELNHMYGNKKKKKEEKENELGQELVDILFTVVCLANQHQIDLSKEWKRMIEEKLHKRDKDRYKK